MALSAPLQAASKTFDDSLKIKSKKFFFILQDTNIIFVKFSSYDFGSVIFLKVVELSLTSGYNNFAIHNPAGTDITVAVIKCTGLAPNDMQLPLQFLRIKVIIKF